MPIGKYISLDANGNPIETNPVVASAGAASAGNLPALDSSGKLDLTVLPAGVAVGTVSIIASEALSAGALVNVWSNAGTPNVRNADASAGLGKQCHGFVLAAVVSGANATVYLDDGTIISGLSGLTPGATYFLSASTAGGTSTSGGTATGAIAQSIGVALSATTIKFSPKAPIVRA